MHEATWSILNCDQASQAVGRSRGLEGGGALPGTVTLGFASLTLNGLDSSAPRDTNAILTTCTLFEPEGGTSRLGGSAGLARGFREYPGGALLKLTKSQKSPRFPANQMINRGWCRRLPPVQWIGHGQESRR
jgi:hypothetical protein